MFNIHLVLLSFLAVLCHFHFNSVLFL
uniref:Uncharacterized protein n=1 Tax=Anguilla anguilla TaxID=7936 RepID=A0A0E9SKP9_ANGAN